jgi:hypothetical protein
MKRLNYKLTAFVFFMILLVSWGVIKWLTLENPLESDDINYMTLARELSRNTFVFPEAQLSFRTGILIPLNLLIHLFGYNIFSYYIFSIGFSTLLLIALLLVTREYFGLKTAFTCGLIFISSSLIAFQSTNLLPDIPAFAWALFSLYFFTKALSNKKFMTYIILSALAGFFTWTSKEPVIIFFLAFPLFEYFKNSSVRRSAYFLTFLLALWVIESAVYYFITGDFFARRHAVGTGIKNWEVNQYEIPVSEFLFGSFKNILSNFSGKFLFVCSFFIGIPLAISRNNSRILIFLFAGLLIFIIYNYTVYSLDPLIPALPPQLRYIVGFFSILSIVSAWSLTLVYNFLRKCFPIHLLKAWGLGLMFLIPAIQLTDSMANPNTVLNRGNPYLAVIERYSDRFPANPADTVYALPCEAFRLYPGFSKLNLVKKLPAGPHYVLFSKDYARYQYEYAQKANDTLQTRMFQDYTAGLNIKKVIDYHRIVLAQVSSNQSSLDTVFSMQSSGIRDFLWCNEKEFKISADENQCYTISILDSKGTPYYFYSFRGDFGDPPVYDPEIIPLLKPDRFYRLIVKLNVKYSLDDLFFVVMEYDSKAMLKRDELQFEHPQAGDHSLELAFRSASKPCRFKFYIRVKNIHPGNSIYVKNVILLQDK